MAHQNVLQFGRSRINLGRMKPLALVLYEQLLPGTQLINRLQDCGYRVRSTSAPRELLELARTERPLFVLADLRFTLANICDTLRQLKADEATQHIAIIAFADPADTRSQTAALDAGAAVVAGSDGILDQLEALLDQALHVE
jgi:CheY-like chemotaxis protein